MKQLIHNIKDKKVMVIGDIIFDRYIFGTVQRISPEAPVPIINVKEESFVPGGAANTAHNISALGGKAYLVGICGDDIAQNQLIDFLYEKDVDTEGIITDKTRSTIEKLRIIGDKQQIARVDNEKTDPIAEKIKQKILDIVKKNLSKVRVIVFSDYAKGVLSKDLCQEIIKLAKDKSIITIADPKPSNKDYYKGVSFITPNFKEAKELAKDMPYDTEEDIKNMIINIEKELDTKALVTRSEKGISLLDDDKLTTIPTQAKEVFDVSGAGDTVVATLALALAAGAEVNEAVNLANHAAGIVVSKIGTATVSNSELQKAFEKESSKVKTLEELKEIVKKLKSKNKKIVWTNGCFDILHVGHTRYLQEAKKQGDILILGLNSDTSIRRIKGKDRPIINEDDRAEVLSALSCVDYIIFFDSDTPIEEIKAIMPDIIVKGSDYKKEEVIGHELMDKAGGKVALIQLVDGKSTTNIIDKIIKKYNGNK